jgi:hypothetical protein
VPPLEPSDAVDLFRSRAGVPDALAVPELCRRLGIAEGRALTLQQAVELRLNPAA